MAGHLHRPGGPEVGDDDVLAVTADPDRLAGQTVRHRVQRPVPLDHGLVDAHCPGQSQGGGVGMIGETVQAKLFGGQHLGRHPPGDPVGAVVDLLAERGTGRFQFGPAGVLGQEVGVGGHQVRLGHPYGGFRAALGGGIGGQAGMNGEAVVTGGDHHVGIADGDAGHVVDAQRLLVIRQAIGGHPAEGPQGGVDAGDDRGQGLVPDGDDHPEPAPRQPCAEQGGLGPGHHRSVAVVPLEPQAGLDHPGPVDPAPPGPIGDAHLGHRPPCGALRAGKAHGHQLVVHDVSADLALGGVHPLLDLGQEGFDDPRARLEGRAQSSGVTPCHLVGDGLVVTAHQLSGVSVAVGQIESFEYLHDLLGMLHVVPPRAWMRQTHAVNRGGAARRWTRRGKRTVAGEICRPQVGSSRVRQRGGPCPPMGRISWPSTQVLYVQTFRPCRVVTHADDDDPELLGGRPDRPAGPGSLPAEPVAGERAATPRHPQHGACRASLARSERLNRSMKHPPNEAVAMARPRPMRPGS